MTKYSNDRGQISLDFLVGISIFLVTFFFIVYSLSGLTLSINPYNDKYSSVNALADQLIKKPGLGKNDSTCWEQYWKENNEEVKSIGLSSQKGDKPPNGYKKTDRPIHYVLSIYKVGDPINEDLNGLMTRHGSSEENYWWEFGEEINETNYSIFLEKSGIYPRFDVYLQLRPLNTNASMSQADLNIDSYVPNDKDLVKTERIVYIERYDQDENKWIYLKNEEGEVIRYSLLVWDW